MGMGVGTGVGIGAGVEISCPEKLKPGTGPEAKGKSPAAVKASARFIM